MQRQFLADAASNLYPARMQMAFSLGWHIIFSCFGITFPTLVLFVEWRAHRRGDADLKRLPHTWAKAMGAMFAAGAVSGTILSFEMGILWPGLMERFGEVFGFPFILEGFTFFIEAIFLGIYLFSWGRLPPRVHLLTGLPIIPAGLAGAYFVISANGWMNSPQGYDINAEGHVVNVDVIDAMFNPSTMAQWLHMIVAAFMVVGFLVAARWRSAGCHRAARRVRACWRRRPGSPRPGVGPVVGDGDTHRPPRPAAVTSRTTTP